MLRPRRTGQNARRHGLCQVCYTSRANKPPKDWESARKREDAVAVVELKPDFMKGWVPTRHCTSLHRRAKRSAKIKQKLARLVFAR